jgi:hypothetical protein
LTDPQAQRYVLPAEDNTRIFREDIVPDLFTGRERQAQPLAMVLMAQQGAGKTRVAAAIAQVLNARGGFIDVDTDLYKPYHPKYDELIQLDDRMMAAYTGPDGRAWMDQAQAYVREHKLNVLLQETGQSPAFLARTLQDYRSAGFRVEVVALAVHESVSQQGIIHRYHEQVKERGHGRLTVPEKAALAYQGIPDAALLIDEQRLADFTTVVRRGEDVPRYRNKLVDGRWQEEPRFREAIKTERVRRLTSAEAADFISVQAKLRAEMGPQWHGRLDIIEAAATALMSPQDQETARTSRIASLAARPITAPPVAPRTPPAPRPAAPPAQGRGPRASY